MVSRDSKVDNFTNSLFIFCCCWLLLGLVFWPRLRDPCVCQNLIGVTVCHFLGKVLGCAYTICSYCQISISCTFSSESPCPPSRVLSYTLSCANLLHSLIMWLIVLFLSPHSLHFLFCWVLSILALIWWVLMVLFCAAIRRDSVSLYYYYYWPFHTSFNRYFFHLSLSDNKSPHISRTFLRILTDFNSAVVWMVSTIPLVSISLSFFIKLMRTTPSASITIGITVSLIYHSLFHSRAKS